MAELIDANLAGDTVIQIRFDYAVTIVTERSQLRIQTEFEPTKMGPTELIQRVQRPSQTAFLLRYTKS